MSGIVDIEALRNFRTMNLNSNWIKDLRTELFRRMYDSSIHPQNLWLHDEPGSHAEVDHVYRSNIGRLLERGTFTAPAHAFPGARYQSPNPGGAAADWSVLSRLWTDAEAG